MRTGVPTTHIGRRMLGEAHLGQVGMAQLRADIQALEAEAYVAALDDALITVQELARRKSTVLDRDVWQGVNEVLRQKRDSVLNRGEW